MTAELHDTTTGRSLFDQTIARIAVGGYDDYQAVRKATLNRVRDVIRKKREGIPFDAVEDEKDDPDYSSEYADDNLPELIAEMFAADELTQHERDYLDHLLTLARESQQIEEQFKDIMEIVEYEPIYREYLQHVNGVGGTLAARLIHQFGYCEDFDRVSELWSYSGLAPGQKRERGETLGYNPKAKTLGWMVADCMVKQGDRSDYRTAFYDPYKRKQLRRMERADDMTEEQLDQQPWTPPQSQGHANNRAMRYLAKKFLKHYWAISRDLADEDVPDEWVITHGGHDKRTDTFENPFYALDQLRD